LGGIALDALRDTLTSTANNQTKLITTESRQAQLF
jgi:hypothetical protein